MNSTCRCSNNLLECILAQAIVGEKAPMAHKHETIGHYHILDTLARGARGYIYRAEDNAARGMPVAVKVIESVPLHTDNDCTAFRQEVEHVRMLQHAAIVPIIDAGLLA